MNITKTDIEKWNELDTYMYGRAKSILDIIHRYNLERSIYGLDSLDSINANYERKEIDVEFTTCCMGEYDRGLFLSFPIEWFESDCDYKKKIFERYNYTPENDE